MTDPIRASSNNSVYAEKKEPAKPRDNRAADAFRRTSSLKLKSARELGGSDTPVVIQGGSPIATSTPKRNNSPVPTPAGKKREDSPMPPITRSVSFAGSTASSRNRSAGAAAVSSAAAPVLHRPPSTKQNGGKKHMDRLPGTTDAQTIVRKPKTALETHLAATPFPLSPRGAGALTPTNTTESPPLSDSLWIADDVEADLQEMERSHEERRNGGAPDAAPAVKKEKRGSKSATPEPSIDFSQFRKGPHGDLVVQMMQNALAGTDELDRLLFMDEPDIEVYPPAMHPEPSRKILGDSINLYILNALFEKKGQSEHRRRFSIGDDLDAMIQCSPVLPTAEEIRGLEMTPEESGRVKSISFFQAGISDAQLAALVEMFPLVERVDLNMCPELTDAGISSLARLKYLKEFDLSHCPKMTHAGLSALSLEQLEVFSVSTDDEMGVPLFTRLAASPGLRKVVFTMCSKLSPDELACLAKAHQLFPITVRLIGCDKIKSAATDAINEVRVVHPITFTFAAADDPNPSEMGQPAAILMPPPIPPADDILSSDNMLNFFDENTLENNRILPHASVIEDMGLNEENSGAPEAASDAIEEPLIGPEFRGIDLAGRFTNDSLDALVQRFPKMRIVRITDNPELSHLGGLKQLREARTLYLGRLSGTTMKMVETMFQNGPQNEKTWQQLTDVHLTEMPISDAALKFLSLLPNLRNLTLASCDLFTVQGFKQLAEGCLSLESLTLVDCPSIDPPAVQEFRTRRPNVHVKADLVVDVSAAKMAVIEADKQIWLGLLKHKFIFRPGLESQNKPDAEAVNKFYSDQLALIEVQLEIDPKAELITHWRRADLVLQEYANLTRTAWALRKEMIRVGFFLYKDTQRAPRTVEEVIQYLRQKSVQKSGKEDFDYRRKIQVFDFEDLGLSRIPAHFYESISEWEQVKGILLKGNLFDAPPEHLVELCPMLNKPVNPEDSKQAPRPAAPPAKGLWNRLFGSGKKNG